MTKELIAILLDRIEELPPQARDEIMRSIVDIMHRHEGTYRLTDEERADVREGLAEIERGEPAATDEEVEAAFRKYGA